MTRVLTKWKLGQSCDGGASRVLGAPFSLTHVLMTSFKLSRMSTFVINFAHDYLAFRWPEVDSIKSIFNLNIAFPDRSFLPFVVCQAENEQQIKDLCSRCVLIKSAYELWHEDTNIDSLVSHLCQSPLVKRYAGKSFKVIVEAFNKTIKAKYKVDQIEKMIFLDELGDVNLVTPEVTLSLLEYYGLDQINVPEEPLALYFGRKICDSHRVNIHKFNLAHRKFISNTSMDPTLAILVANIAKVKPNDLVYDPFVGSGSLLVAAADFGAYVMGSDIDYKLLMGMSRPSRPNVKKRGPDETIRDNLFQYGLHDKYIDILLADASKSVIRPCGQFDSIICDPPYGIRESSVKVGSKKSDPTVPEECIGIHFPAKIQYNLADVIVDLLDYAATALVPGGRLVYWQPLMNDMQMQAPQHSAFDLVCICRQNLTRNTARVLICLERKSETKLQLRECVRDENAANFKNSYEVNVRTKPKEAKWARPERHKK